MWTQLINRFHTVGILSHRLKASVMKNSYGPLAKERVVRPRREDGAAVNGNPAHLAPDILMKQLPF